jgi:hypothetical protein
MCVLRCPSDFRAPKDTGLDLKNDYQDPDYNESTTQYRR